MEPTGETGFSNASIRYLENTHNPQAKIKDVYIGSLRFETENTHGVGQ